MTVWGLLQRHTQSLFLVPAARIDQRNLGVVDLVVTLKRPNKGAEHSTGPPQRRERAGTQARAVPQGMWREAQGRHKDTVGRRRRVNGEVSGRAPAQA